MKLEHIAPYLPYGVKCEYIGIINGKELAKFKKMDINNPLFKDYPDEEFGVKTAELKSIDVFRHYWVAKAGIYRRGLKSFVNGSGMKPILHPLSDLTKPCLPDGKIPIVELAKISYSKLEWDISIDNDGICYVGDVFNARQYRFGYYGSEGYFGCTHIRSSESKIVPYQLQLFQKLFSWHFDVFGLIESGEAIDINILKAE